MKLIMVINCSSDPYVPVTAQSKPLYVTVTMVPSLHNCQDCQRVAATFDVEGNCKQNVSVSDYCEVTLIFHFTIILLIIFSRSAFFY
jgi:DDB1-and CUL4-substrate receptor 15, WD repeat